MTLEAKIFTTLGPLVANRVYPDTTPDNAKFPCITYQQVGGRDYNYVDGSLPDNEHARIQLNVHGTVRSDVKAIALSAKALMAGQLLAEVMGSLTTDYDDIPKLYSTRQDFGCWFPQ